MLTVIAAAIGCTSPPPSTEVALEVARDFAIRTGAEPIADAAAERRLGVAWVQAALSNPLTDDAAVKIALLRNPRVAETLESLGVARGELIQAGLLKNPVFQGHDLFFGGTSEIELGISQSFLEIFFIPLRRQAAEADFAAQRAMVTRELVALVFDVRRALVAFRGAARMVVLQSQAFEAAQAAWELMRKLHDAGNVITETLVMQESAMDQTKVNLAMAEAAMIDVREPLNVLLGLWGRDTGWTVAGELGEPPAGGLDFEAVESRAIAASLDLQAGRAMIDAYAQHARLDAKEQALGSAEIGPAGKQETDGAWGAGPALSFDIPIFDFGQGRRVSAEARLRQAMYHHEALAIEIRSAARTFRDRIRVIEARVAFMTATLLPGRARVVREILKNYNAMQVGAFDVLMARQQEIESGRDLVDTLRDAWLARYDLEELLAGCLDRERLNTAPASNDHQVGSMAVREEH